MAELRNGYSQNPRALWVGEVPDVWEFFKGKYVFGERFEKGNEKNLELLSPTQKYGVIPQSMYDKLSGMRAVKVKESTDLALFKTVHTGDFCISLRSFQGGFEYSRYEGVVSPAYHILFPKKNIVDGYYKYLFKETSFIAEMNSYCQSLRDGKNISYEDFGKTVIPYPPLDEQRAIADYLDERCSKIDEIIAEATTSIEEYKELKQAVIDEALAGYNEIHIKLRQLGTLKNGLNFSHSDDDPNIMFLGVGCVKDNMFLDKQEQFDDLHVDFEVSEEYLLRDGDIVFVRSNGSKELVGRSVMVRNIDYPLTYSGFCIRFRNECTDLVMNEYLLYFFRTNHFKQSLLKYSNDSTNINNLNQEMLNAIRIDAPIIDKQREIVDFLDIRVGDMDALISEKQALIDDLQAYKKSLIYEVVTGKRRVV